MKNRNIMKKAILNMKAFYISLFVVLFFPLGLMGQEVRTFSEGDMIFIKDVNDIIMCVESNAEGDVVLSALPEGSFATSAFWKVIKVGLLPSKYYFQNIVYGNYLKYDAKNGIYSVVETTDEATEIETRNSEWYLGTKTEYEDVEVTIKYVIKQATKNRPGDKDWTLSEKEPISFSKSYTHTFYCRPYYDGTNWVDNNITTTTDVGINEFKSEVEKAAKVTGKTGGLLNTYYAKNDTELDSYYFVGSVPKKKVSGSVNTSTRAFKPIFNFIPNEERQEVHEFREVIYAANHDSDVAESYNTVKLSLPVEGFADSNMKEQLGDLFNNAISQFVQGKLSLSELSLFVESSLFYLSGYYRWYDYKTGKKISQGEISHEGYKSSIFSFPAMYFETQNGFGDILLPKSNCGVTSYILPEDFGSKFDSSNKPVISDPIIIACDVSNYSNFTMNVTSDGKIQITEPTLSYRVIYEIHDAQEMCNILDPTKNSNEYLETYNIIAPAGKTVMIGHKYAYSNYYTKTTSSSKIGRLAGTWNNNKKSGMKWSKDGVQINHSYISDRLISITAPTQGTTVTYTATYTPNNQSHSLKLAKFVVTGYNPGLVGPSETALQKENFYEADDRDNLEFDLKAELDFDDIYDLSNPKMCPNPLQWEDISAGFVYPGLIDSKNKQREPKFAAMSEYALLSTTKDEKGNLYKKCGYDLPLITNHGEDLPDGKKGEGYFLYVDATKKPSKVADLSINGDLCPNSKIYVSAWIANASNESSNYPNLNFVMMGVGPDVTGKISETQVATFTTGEVTTKGKWMHIMFEFETTNFEYDKYRIRIENNNAAVFGTGNDFAIDDIKIYMTSRTEASITQNRSCPSWNPTNSDLNKSNVAILRADIIDVPDGDIYMNYTWLKQIGESADGKDVDVELLDLKNYIDVTANEVDPAKIFGKIKVDKAWIENISNTWGEQELKKDVTISTDPLEKIVVYKNTDAFFALNDFSDDLEASAYFFTIEGEGDDARIVLYIVHKSSLFQQFEEYCSIVTPINLDNYISEYKEKYKDSDDEDALEALYNELKCGTRSKFEVLPYASIMLSKDASNNYDFDFTQAVVKHLAKGQSYTFAVEAYYEDTEIKDGKTVKVMKPYNCYADWLLVTNDAEKWNDAQKIIAWRANGGARPILSQGNTLVKESLTSFQVENFSGPLHYIAIPNPKVAVGGNTPCAIPVEIYLYDSIPATLADPTINNNKVDEPDRPAAISNEPIIVRIPNSLVKDNGNISLNLDIDYFDEYLFAEIAKYNAQEGNTNLYPLNNIYLYNENKQLVETPIKFNITTTETDENDQTLTLDLLNKDDDVTISGGHTFASGQKYHFAGLNEVNGVKITPPFQFDVYVVPDEVVWTGDDGTAWHNDANWNPAIIPMSHTNVVIPGNTTNKPVLNPSENKFESGAYKWFEHDIVAESKGDNNLLVEAQSEDQSDDLSAVLNSCKDIYFEAGAQLVNQHTLNYERAFVDVPFINDNKFKIMSFPLRNVYRGDLYIPRNYDEKAKKDIGDGDFDFDFSQTDGQFKAVPVDNRAYNSFYVKAYDSAIKQNHVVDNNGKNEVDYSKYDEYNYENTSWSNPTSVLNFKFEEAHGYAVSLNANTSQSFVRLPKSATKYYLFMDFGSGTEEELNGPTWPKYETPREVDDEGHKLYGHKLVYDKSHGASVTFENKKGNIFLIGNPFMTGMSVEKFLAGNTDLDSMVYYTYSDGTISVNVKPNEKDIIPPFGAMFVKGKTNSVEQTFKFTSEMMSDTESTDPTQQRAPRMVEERELLTITAEVDGARSRTYIEKDFAANNEYLDTEDADLLVLDADLTPISVYSVATGAALAYNSVTDMEFVPLGLLLVDSTIVAESVRFTFDGVDYFYDELYLYDALYNSYLPLIDGVALELEMPESGELRYFITDTKHNVGGGVTTSDDLVEGSKVCVFTTEGEACIIAEDIISEATVYDIAGRLIYYSDQISSSQHNISLPNGVYMLKVVVNSNLSTHKIILK